MMCWLLIFLIAPLVDCHTAASEFVALYSASFDPPTRSHLRMLRCALGAADLPQECQEIGSQISRLIILVNAAPTIEARASAKERVLMLTRALQANRPRVEISAQSPTAIEQQRHARPHRCHGGEAGGGSLSEAGESKLIGGAEPTAVYNFS